jgi:hypothetical protein
MDYWTTPFLGVMATKEAAEKAFKSRRIYTTLVRTMGQNIWIPLKLHQGPSMEQSKRADKIS